MTEALPVSWRAIQEYLRATEIFEFCELLVLQSRQSKWGKCQIIAFKRFRQSEIGIWFICIATAGCWEPGNLEFKLIVVNRIKVMPEHLQSIKFSENNRLLMLFSRACLNFIKLMLLYIGVIETLRVSLLKTKGSITVLD